MTSPPLNRVKVLAKTAETDGYSWSLAVSEGNKVSTSKGIWNWLFFIPMKVDKMNVN